MPLDVLTILKELGPYAFYAYLFVVYALPKLWPQLFRWLNRRVTTEDRLYSLIKDNNEAFREFSVVLTRLDESLKSIIHRIERVEDTVKNNKCPSSNNKD